MSALARNRRGCIAHLGHNEGLDKHHNAACNYRRQRNDVERANYIEDYVAWTGQMFCGEEGHD